MKAEDRLELIGWKAKNTQKMWYWDVVMCKWKNFSFNCLFSNVEEINLLLSVLKKAKNKNFDFCYLMANNQLKCGIIYKKVAVRVGDDAWIHYWYWGEGSFQTLNLMLTILQNQIGVKSTSVSVISIPLSFNSLLNVLYHGGFMEVEALWKHSFWIKLTISLSLT